MPRRRRLARKLPPRLKPPVIYRTPDPLYPDEPYPSYEAYLASAQWAHLRQKAMREAHGLCQRCRFNTARNAHHTSYPRDWRNDRVGNLLAVCTECHKSLHHRAPHDAWRQHDDELPSFHAKLRQSDQLRK